MAHYYRLICDYCGKKFEQQINLGFKPSVAVGVIITAALEAGWLVSGGGKIVCPECRTKALQDFVSARIAEERGG